MGTDGAEEIHIDLIHFPVFSLGMGKRTGIWLQGCSIRCEGCISAHTWIRDENCRVTVSAVMEEILRYKSSNPDGITISGGEPFDQNEALERLLGRLRESGFRDILVYSGYDYAYLLKRYPGTLELIDVLIDGRFIPGMETEHIWKGSDNQNIIILTKDPELQRKYFIYTNRRGPRELQLIERKEKLYIIGIPQQKDSEVIKNGFY